MGSAAKSACGSRDDGFYYDVVRVKGGPPLHLKVRSFVGLIPLFAVLAIEPGTLERLPQFRRRVEWYIRYRPVLAGNLCLMMNPGRGGRRLMALADRAKLERVLPRVVDPSQFLSEYGLRSLSRGLADEPFFYDGNRVAYEPAESASPIYGGNSNWRGPIWFPVNYLLIDALRELHSYYGSTFTVELPVARDKATLEETAAAIAGRLACIFLRDASGRPPFSVTKSFSILIPIGANTSRFMNTFTATMAEALGPATRPVGPL